MTLRDDLLPLGDLGQSLQAEFGLSRFSVTIRRRVWSGSQIGEGTATVYDIPITPAPRVRDAFPAGKLSPLEAEYAVANSNIVTGQMYRIDKITPRYTSPTTGGYLAEELRLWPNRDNRTVENLVVLIGDDGYLRECGQISFEQDRAFGYSMLVKEMDRSVAPLSSVAVTPTGQTIAPAATLAMTATGTFVGGSTSILTTLATWTSSDLTVATVDIFGAVTGVSAGTATISASVLGQFTGSATVTVS